MKPNNAPLPGGFVLNNLRPLPRSIDTGSSHETLKRNKYISYLSNYCSIESRLFFAQHNISSKNKIFALNRFLRERGMVSTPKMEYRHSSFNTFF